MVQADPVEFGFQVPRVADLVQVWVFALDAPEQGLDPGPVVRGARTVDVPPDPDRGHERRRVLGGHRRPVVADRQQDGDLVTVRDHAGGELGEQGVVEQMVLARGVVRARGGLRV